MIPTLYQGDSLQLMLRHQAVTCIFADPPDNIGLSYQGYRDSLELRDYLHFLRRFLTTAMKRADIIWLSFNAKWTVEVGHILYESLLDQRAVWQVKPCIQTFTFGQHRQSDLGNCHRPLWRIKKTDAPIYPEHVKVSSWRQRNGDKRAAAGGKIPSDVFDFPRVVGNSKQRQSWHPTQLHEGLVERCILLSTKPGDTVLDPFAGTGTTYRVCKRIGRLCSLMELCPTYCDKLHELHPELAKAPPL